MSKGYSFHCTPCGFAHAGECAKLKCGCSGSCKGHVVDAGPPVDMSPPAKQDGTQYQVTIIVGSRWRLEHKTKGMTAPWLTDGYPDGYEIMAIVADSSGRAAIQVREWNAPHYPVYTCAIDWWDPDGIGASDGGRNRFVVWT